MNHKIYEMSVADVYVHYLKKVERKGQSEADLIQVMKWLTGFDTKTLKAHLKAGTTFRAFFKAAKLHPNAKLITGSICGVKIAEIEDPLMKKIRYMDKLVDELANGRPMDKILRKAEAKSNSNCPVTSGLVDLSKYEELDGEWRKIGLAAPARRALVDAKLYKVSDLRKISARELAELHGMGKSAIARINQIMKAKSIRFR